MISKDKQSRKQYLLFILQSTGQWVVVPSGLIEVFSLPSIAEVPKSTGLLTEITGSGKHDYTINGGL